MKNNIKRGFTLVELLVVMTILAVLSFLAVPQFVKMQKQANEKTFTANHRMIVSALSMYAADKDGKFPEQATWNADLMKYLSPSEQGANISAANKGLGQAGVTFVYKKPANANSSTVVLKSVLGKDYTVSGGSKTLEYKIN